jgi:hypothetical protein
MMYLEPLLKRQVAKQLQKPVDDVMKASIAKAQKEARYKVESAKINVQAKEASKKADSLIDDFKKYEKQTMETNLKDEAFVKAQKAGAEKVDKLKDASIKLAENPILQKLNRHIKRLWRLWKKINML